ncbi:hypothetical protein VZQ01_09610 [Myxococcus faecalis]|uniref:hypothetical protein n=1 Tax=Myxococcus faecalis TaxID=3115646 RepID=UPI003CEA5754
MRVTTSFSTITRWLILGLSLFGAKSFAGYVSAPDGYILLGIETSNRYYVAGGARFFIPPAQHSLYSGRSTVALPQATIDSYTQVPMDGTLFRQIGTTPIYVVVGQRPWWIPNPTELDVWDDWKEVHNIPNSNWNDPFIDYTYAMSLLVQERTTSQIYLWVAGAKYLLTDPADIAYFGGYGSVKTVPLGTLASVPNEPFCGAVLRERSSSTLYAVGYINSSTPGLRKHATTHPTHGVVPDGALSAFPTMSSGLSCIW